jgi:L-lactate utilization protein LutC
MARTKEGLSVSREAVLYKVRSALGRSAGQALTGQIPSPLLLEKTMDVEARVASFSARLEALAGKVVRVPDTRAAGNWVGTFLSGHSAVAANSTFLDACGIPALPGVQSGFQDKDALRTACATADIGISSVDYALAETGSMVMIASPEQARLVSLLPPVHVAVFPKSKILVGLDELFTLLPKPAERTSSMVFITGPSRTADIEQILVRGVHGPREVHVVIVEA